MERVNGTPTNLNQMAKGLLPAATPVVLILIGYIDPGKWATCIDIGARFGGDLVLFALAFNIIGVLCRYLSARITVVSGRNLTQICTQEYDKLTCFFLGVQAEVSVISLDLTMILGLAYGLNMIFGLDLFTGILLTALNAVLYPLFSSLLETSKAKFFVVFLAGLTIVCYVLGLLSSLPELTTSSSGLVSKLSGESAFALMGLLGSSVMPHNFYLHSSIVLRYQGSDGMSKSVWSQDNFMFNFAISSGMFLVNYVLMISAANGFYSTGIGFLSFQDIVSLLDQTYRNTLVPVGSFVVLFLANQIVASSSEFCEGGESGEKMLHDFFNMDLPEWLHRATVRIIAVVIALFCLWQSGAEGMYHLLICTQVMVALLLPSSVIPLFRIASSRPVMGLHKISPVLEFVVLLTFMGMLGLELIFVVEMIFGESDWVGNLRWSISNGTSMSYMLLLFTASISFFIMLWLAATPLKSSTNKLDSQPWTLDAQQAVPESFTERENTDIIETRFCEVEPINIKKEFTSLEEKSLRSQPTTPTSNHDINLPDTIMDTVQELYVSNKSELSDNSLYHPEPEQSATRDSDHSFLKSIPVAYKQTVSDEKALKIEGELPVEKDDDGFMNLEESSKDVSGFGPSTTPEGPGSFRSLSGKSDEGGTGPGSLSRLSGLGRAARRQFAAILDEFWGQLYDFHGHLNQEAKAKKFDMLLGCDSKQFQSLSKSESTGKEYGIQSQALGVRVSDNSSFYDNPNQQKLQNSIESAFRAHRGSTSIWSNQLQSLDSYVQSSNRSLLDSGERRYQSLRLPASSESLDYQPATIHSYQLASYANRAAKERPDYAFGQLDHVPQKSTSLVPNNYGESFGFASGQKSANGLNALQQSSFQNLAVQRNNVLQSERPSYDHSTQSNSKQYHSLPDISGLSVPLRNSYLSDRNMQFGSSNTSMGFKATVGRTGYEHSPIRSTGSRPLGPLALRHCILKVLKSEGSEWLFRANDGVDEDLIDRVATRERFVFEVESRDGTQPSSQLCDPYSERGIGANSKGDEAFSAKLISSVPHCGEECVWKVDLIASFGVWCIRRILELSLMESRPELWGKYTYVLNRLQGVIDFAFFKPRTPITPCFCLQIPASYQRKPSSPISNGMLPPAIRPTKGKVTTSSMILDVIKDVEIAISCRKGRSGTAAGDVAFPKGKENLASVLKRYKRRLSNRPVVANESGPGSRKL